MSSLKFTNQNHWNVLEAHLTGGQRERFAFAHTRLLATSIDGPALEVIDIELIDDGDVETDGTGWYISETAIDHLHSGAVIGGYGLVEFHYHHCGPPAFSSTDELGLTPMAEYVTGLLDRPYGAGVYAVDRVHVEHWTNRPGGVSRGTFRSVTVMGDHLRLVNAPIDGRPSRLARQADLLGLRGSATLARLRIAVVGAGGTGSHTAVALAYLGARDVLVLDDDQVEITNLNRLVTAGHADIDTPKNITARRRMREIDPDIHVRALPALTSEGDHPELDDVDIIIGCVDNDGPRDRLNQISVDTATPYVDIATGVNPDTTPPTVGGRVILVTPNGPCLHCHGELDPAEVSRWAKNPEQQETSRNRGDVPLILGLEML